LDKYFTATEGISSIPHHIEDGDNVGGSQPRHVTPDSQSGRSYTWGVI